MTITIETIHSDMLAVRADITGLRQDITRLEAKIDSKPSLMAMFTAIVIVVFGVFGSIASAVTMLNALGFIRPLHS